jgi:hypothetical protein
MPLVKALQSGREDLNLRPLDPQSSALGQAELRPDLHPLRQSCRTKARKALAVSRLVSCIRFNRRGYVKPRITLTRSGRGAAGSGGVRTGEYRTRHESNGPGGETALVSGPARWRSALGYASAKSPRTTRHCVDRGCAARYARRVDLVAPARMDKTAFSVGHLHDPDDTKHYWATKTPEERLAAVELMRQVLYGYNPSTDRLQRVLAVAQREPG